jgi:hypothetical protein
MIWTRVLQEQVSALKHFTYTRNQQTDEQDTIKDKGNSIPKLV